MNLLNENEITLCLYEGKFRNELEAFYLPEQQLEFTELPGESLKKCLEDKDRFPVVVTYLGHAVGFFVMSIGEAVKVYSDNEQAVLLRAYLINLPEQGKGFAVQSIKKLALFVQCHFPLKNEIVLAVNKRNTGAQKVYKRGGFIDTGKRVIGPKGLQYIFHLKIGEERL
ncbi:GNAT family N-acetyltransferase [Shouchella lonarensis]|uniref:N-acetyltransferase domain-containing protein n=1 Tax=Shouchella lonarensis TaxID=1464122 RepID=A0A1G6LU87_9BACI|nr:GNAT family protein [Shouchella lonarensis]SDC46759.1 hypothetical protein SAMN05421737_1092 [Shouchella lonarensis]